MQQTTKVQTSLKSILAASALLLTFGSAIAANEAVNDTAEQHATVVAQAQSDLFSQMDVNKDGAIDKKEASASPTVTKTFGQADTNNDGKLSRAEFESGYQKAE